MFKWDGRQRRSNKWCGLIDGHHATGKRGSRRGCSNGTCIIYVVGTPLLMTSMSGEKLGEGILRNARPVL